MNIKKSISIQWILLPVLFSSAAVLAGGAGGLGTATSSAGQSAALLAEEDGFLDDASAVNSTNMGYVGGNTRIGIGFDTEFRGRIDASHVFTETEHSVTSGQGWIGIDPTADEDKYEEIITGVGAKINHHWLSSDESGTPLHVNKVFGAYDQNATQDQKVTAGYGQERENMFWSGHVSKGLSDKRQVGYGTYNKPIYEQGFDYGVGGRVGAFMDEQLLRLQGGLDYEWGTEIADSEETASQLSVSGGVEKFFADSPHSIGANVSVSKKNGGYIGDEHEADVSGNVSYRYDFGGTSLFASDEQYRRVRVEIPGKTEVVKVRKQHTAQAGQKLVKHTMEMEADTFFKRGDYHLTNEAKQRLRTMIARIRQAGHHGNIRVTGHASPAEASHAGQVLSEKRAAQVRNFMIANGFEPDQVLAVGLGATQPKYPNNAGSSHKNQRVDIEYVTVQNNIRGNGVIEQGSDIEERTRVISEPRVVWRKELISSAPSWVGQALRNNIHYKQSISTYRTLGVGASGAIGGGGSGGTNSAPTLIDDNASTAINQSVMIDVLSNDNDADGDRLSISSHDTRTVNDGQVTLQADTGKLIYGPAADFSGTDTFTYTVTDGNGNFSTATVTVVVQADNGGSGVGGSALNAVNDSVSTAQGTQVMIDVLANDSNAATLLGHADVSVNGGIITRQDNKLLFTPAQGFNGTDSFVYTISDSNGNQANATVTITVEAVSTGNKNPTANDDSGSTSVNTAVSLDVLANDSDADGDTVSIQTFDGSSTNGGSVTSADGLLVYTPADGFSGTDTFTYSITDGNGGTAMATVSITVETGDKAALKLENDGTQGELPGDSYSFYSNDVVTRSLDVLANDSGDELEIIAITVKPRFGSAFVSSDGQSVNYTLRSGYCEDHFFEYRVRDKHGNEADARVYINIIDDNKDSNTDSGSASGGTIY